MKRHIYYRSFGRILLSFLGVLLIFGWNASAQPNDSRAKLLETFNRFTHAFKAANVVELDKLLTADYVHTNGGKGTLNRKQWLNWLETRRKDVDSGKLTYTSYEIRGLATRMYDDAAILTGRVVATGKHGTKPIDVDIRFTQTWIEKDGTWKRAAFHDVRTQQ